MARGIIAVGGRLGCGGGWALVVGSLCRAGRGIIILIVGAWVIMWGDRWWDGRGVLCRWDLMGGAGLLLARSSRWALNGLGVLWVGLVDCFGRSIGCDPFLLDMLGLIFMGRMGSLPPLRILFRKIGLIGLHGRVGHCVSWVACPIVGVCGFMWGCGTLCVWDFA